MDIKEEDPFSEHVASLSEIEFFTNSDAVLLDDDCEVASKAEVKSEAPFPDFCSQNERNFLLEDHEMDNKIEIKEEPWWLETQSSSVCNDINVRGFAPVKLSRLHTKTRSGDCCGKTPFLSTEVSGRETSFNKGKDQPEYASDRVFPW